MRTRRLTRAAALTTLVVVGLSGCMKVDMDMQLQSDDTVDGTMIFAVSRDLAEMAGEDPESLAEQMGADALPMDEGEGEFTQKPYDDGDFIGTEVTFSDVPLSSFAEEGTEESLRFVREGDEFVVTGNMDMTDSGGMEGLGAGMANSFDVQISVTFPGAVSEHNGELSGRTVTWKPVVGETNPINARGSAIDGGGDGLNIALIVGIGAAALLLIGLVLFFVLRGRKKPAAPAVAGYPTEGYAGYTAPAPGYAPQAPTAPEGYTGYAAPAQGYAPQAPTAPEGYAAPPAQPAEGYTQPAPPAQPEPPAPTA